MSEKMEGIAACENTDRHLWPQVSDDPDCPKLFVTKGGGIGINVSGHVIVKPLSEWHKLASASSPAQEPVTTEPVAWTNEAQLGFFKELGYRVVPMAMWAFQHSAHPIALYASPAPPQPGREWLPISGMEWPAMPVMLGFWYQGAFKQYIAEHDPAGWMEQGKRTFYPSHMQGWFTHWQPLSAPPAGEPE